MNKTKKSQPPAPLSAADHVRIQEQIAIYVYEL